MRRDRRAVRADRPRATSAPSAPASARSGSALGTATLLATSRLPFAVGTALGLAACSRSSAGARGTALAFAFLSPLASPVAGLFTGLAGLAYAAGAGRRLGRSASPSRRSRRRCSWAFAFPEGGWAPFPFTAYLPIPVFCAACLLVLPREERVLRAGAVLYALGATLAVASRARSAAPRRGWGCCSAARCCCARPPTA